MTVDKAKELPQVQMDGGSGYNRAATGLISTEVQREHGQEVVGPLIRERGLEEASGLMPGSRFSSPGV